MAGTRLNLRIDLTLDSDIFRETDRKFTEMYNNYNKNLNICSEADTLV